MCADNSHVNSSISMSLTKLSGSRVSNTLYGDVGGTAFGVAGAGRRRARRRARRRGHRGPEAVGRAPERGDVLLRLEQDDVDFGCEETAQDHRAAQTDGDAHGGGLHLEGHGDRRRLSSSWEQ